MVCARAARLPLAARLRSYAQRRDRTQELQADAPGGGVHERALAGAHLPRAAAHQPPEVAGRQRQAHPPRRQPQGACVYCSHPVVMCCWRHACWRHPGEVRAEGGS